MAYTEPDIKTNSPRCWKNDVQDSPSCVHCGSNEGHFQIGCMCVCFAWPCREFGRWKVNKPGSGERGTMAWLYPSIQSSCRPSDSLGRQTHPRCHYWEHHQEIWHTLSAFSYTRRYLNKADCSFTFMHFGRHFYLPNTLDNPISANANTRRSRALTSVFDICELKKEIKNKFKKMPTVVTHVICTNINYKDICRINLLYFLLSLYIYLYFLLCASSTHLLNSIITMLFAIIILESFDSCINKISLKL